VSLFTEFLQIELGVPDLEDIEPEDIKQLCGDPVFRALARYCLGKETDDRPTMAPDDSAFDRDELGLDPEEDVDA